MLRIEKKSMAYEQSVLHDAHSELNRRLGAFTIAGSWICKNCGEPWGSPQCDCNEATARRIYTVDLARLFAGFVTLDPERSSVELIEPEADDVSWDVRIV